MDQRPCFSYNFPNWQRQVSTANETDFATITKNDGKDPTHESVSLASALQSAGPYGKSTATDSTTITKVDGKAKIATHDSVSTAD